MLTQMFKEEDMENVENLLKIEDQLKRQGLNIDDLLKHGNFEGNIDDVFEKTL